MVLLAALLLGRLLVAAALYGHPFNWGGSSKTGFVQDMSGAGISWTHLNNTEIGVKGNMRMYLVDNYMAGDWFAANYVSVDLRGKTMSYIVDLSRVPCGVVACLYFVANYKPGPDSKYCDIQPGFGGCYELDIMEANSHAFESSLHSQKGFGFDGSCNEKGCSLNVGRYPYTLSGALTKTLYGPGAAVINTNKAFEVKADMTNDGYMSVTLSQDGKVLPLYNRTSAGNLPDIPPQNQWKLETYPHPGGVTPAAAGSTAWWMKKGLRMVVSLWSGADTHWLDGNACGGQKGDINSAMFQMWGLQVGPTKVAPPSTTPKAKPAADPPRAKTTAKPTPKPQAKPKEKPHEPPAERLYTTGGEARVAPTGSSALAVACSVFWMASVSGAVVFALKRSRVTGWRSRELLAESRQGGYEDITEDAPQDPGL